MTNQHDNPDELADIRNLPKPFAEGLRSLVSKEWMATWNAYHKLLSTVDERDKRIAELERRINQPCHEAEYENLRDKGIAELESELQALEGKGND